MDIIIVGKRVVALLLDLSEVVSIILDNVPATVQQWELLDEAGI